ncbi:hypothetical protein [Salinispira pacifica]|uniref:Porin domain-containing protein n=1 Tax=Salinispira pacifica TaxID=1307761 RepID=V5WDJ8_9SPIO|nr:hypothetical protein [Salinispira pacifica]AHC13634.1 hypothetical protein L21SP2_0190 [Salinispira pacifica]
MKKFNLVLIALLVASVSVFAVDVTPSATVTGEASIAFGYDLQDEYFDITNDASADLTVEFVADTSEEKGEGDVVGYIKISGLEVSLSSSDVVGVFTVDEDGIIDRDDDGDIDDDDKITIPFDVITGPSVEARINLMGPALYVDITNLGAKTDFAAAPDFDDDILDGSEGVNDVSNDAEPAGSVSLVYTGDAFNVTATLGDDVHEDNGFDAALKFGVTAVEALTFDAGVSIDKIADANTIGYGVSLGYDLGVASLGAGLDGNDDGDIQIEGTLGVDVGATADVTFGTDTEVNDLIVNLSTGSLVEVLTLGVDVELADFSDFGLGIDLSVSVDPLSPYVNYTYTEAAQTLKVGTGLAVIENVALDLNYETEDLGNDNGAVTFTSTISY